MIDTFPSPVREYIFRRLLEVRHLAYLQVDAQGRLQRFGGALAEYGLSELHAGQPADEQVSFLVGLLPLPDQALILWSVRMAGGACADLHFWEDAAGVWIVLLNATLEHDRQQAMQQKGNELSLRNEQQSRVLDAHLGKSIAGELLEGRWHIRGGGERRLLTILFADVRDFTPFSERNDPETVFRTLNQYMPAMLDPIEQYGGTVDKIIGDAVMGIFGLDSTSSAVPLQAVQAALQILKNVRAVNAERVQKGERDLGIGIGIATGPVAVGVIGTLERRGFTAIGHHVNFAARLQNYARAGEIVIDEDTRLASTGIDTTFHEITVTLKGFRQAVRAFVSSEP